MGVNTDMLADYDLSGNDFTNYDFDQSGWDLGDYSIDTSATDSAYDFDLSQYFDTDDASWDTEYDAVFDFGSVEDDLFGASEGEDFTTKLYGDTPMDEGGKFNWNAGKDELESSQDDPLGIGNVKGEKGSREFVDEVTKGETPAETRERFMNGEEVEINGKTYVFNPVTGKPELVSGGSGSSWGDIFQNKGLLALLGGAAKGGLTALASSQQGTAMRDLYGDKMNFEREKLKEQARQFDVRQAAKGGGGGSPTQAATHNAALAARGRSFSRTGSFAKR